MKTIGTLFAVAALDLIGLMRAMSSMELTDAELHRLDVGRHPRPDG